jgi:AmmeMemoRadiSam system protein B
MGHWKVKRGEYNDEMRRRLLIILVVVSCAGLSVIRTPIQTYFQPLVVIVPHHNIVAKQRQEVLTRVAKLRPKTLSVILLSPDHFSLGQKGIFYSDQRWHLQASDLEYDQNLGDKITGAAQLNANLVAQDHGIYNQLTDIKTNFPNSRLVPFVIGNKVATSELDRLTDLLTQNCSSDCIVVASVDFSHYLPALLADVHDVYTQKILTNLDVSRYQNLEVDSPQALYVVMQFAKAKAAKSFRVFEHTNSGQAESTSHMFATYSRIMFQTKDTKNDTFSLASSLIRSQSQKGVGDRFFYGVDYFDSQLADEFSPSDKVSMSPGQKSSLELGDNHLEIKLGPDMTVSGVTDAKTTSLVFLPLEASSSSFLRSTAKNEAIRNLFSQIISTEKIYLDYESGMIQIR